MLIGFSSVRLNVILEKCSAEWWKLIWTSVCWGLWVQSLSSNSIITGCNNKFQYWPLDSNRKQNLRKFTNLQFLLYPAQFYISFQRIMSYNVVCSFWWQLSSIDSDILLNFSNFRIFRSILQELMRGLKVQLSQSKTLNASHGKSEVVPRILTHRCRISFYYCVPKICGK